MPEQKQPITFDEVLAVANELRANGAKVSILAVREKLGRGSFSTVKKHLERINQDEKPSAAAIPAQLESLWNEARRAADEALEKDRDALGVLTAELDARLEGMQATVVEATNARTLAEARLADRSAELERTLAHVEDLRAQRDRSESRRAAVEAALADEREFGRQRLENILSALTDLQNSMVQLRGHQTATVDLVGASARSVAADLAEFIVTERESRLSAHDLLRRDARDLVAPFAQVPSSIVQMERNLQRLSRGLTAMRGTRQRSGAPRRELSSSRVR